MLFRGYLSSLCFCDQDISFVKGDPNPRGITGPTDRYGIKQESRKEAGGGGWGVGGRHSLRQVIRLLYVPVRVRNRRLKVVKTRLHVLPFFGLFVCSVLGCCPFHPAVCISDVISRPACVAQVRHEPLLSFSALHSGKERTQQTCVSGPVPL